MGTRPISLFEQSVWQPIEQSGSRTILQNNCSLRQVQKYFASTICESVVNIEDIFQWRCKLPSSSHVVEILQYGIKQSNMCDQIDQYYVITERVHRLGQIPQISKYQGLLAIKQALEALDILAAQFGLFSPDLMNIGVNEQGSIRVWINQNFALNQVREDRNGHPHRQEAVVTNLCHLISSRVYNNSLKGSYPYGYNFRRAINSIQNQINQNKDMFIPKIYSDRQMFTKYYINKAKRQEQEQSSRNIPWQNSTMTYGLTEEISHKKLNQNSKDHSRQLRNPALLKQQNTSFIQHPNIPTRYSVPPTKQVSPILSKPFFQPQKVIKTQNIYQIPQIKHLEPRTPIVKHQNVFTNSKVPKIKVGKQEPKMLKNKKQVLSDMSQIKLKDDIEEVDSVIVAQDDYMEERDKVPISQQSFLKQLALH